MTNCRHFDILFLKLPMGRAVGNVTNISSHFRHYRQHAVIHFEVSANILNRYIFIVCHFRRLPYMNFDPVRIENENYHATCWYRVSRTVEP
jgi:hypothetical protein